jgi:hypothetical protein
MKLIENIDNALTEQKVLLERGVKELVFKTVCVFNTTDLFNNIPFAELNYMGVYLIEIKSDCTIETFNEWFENFNQKWTDKAYEKSFTPNPKKKRINYHKNIKHSGWIPLYLGKSNNICNRLKGHMFLKLNQPTFALKLLERKNLINDVFRLSTIKVEVENYDIIMPIIEKTLRDKYNPILGKQ